MPSPAPTVVFAFPFVGVAGSWRYGRARVVDTAWFHRTVSVSLGTLRSVIPPRPLRCDGDCGPVPLAAAASCGSLPLAALSSRGSPPLRPMALAALSSRGSPPLRPMALAARRLCGRWLLWLAASLGFRRPAVSPAGHGPPPSPLRVTARRRPPVGSSPYRSPPSPLWATGPPGAERVGTAQPPGVRSVGRGVQPQPPGARDVGGGGSPGAGARDVGEGCRPRCVGVE